MIMNKKILYVLKIFLKLFILAILICGFIINYVDIKEVDKYLHYTYAMTMFFCAASFMGTFFKKYRKFSYIVFFVFLGVFFLMGQIPSIKEIQDSITCLEAEQGVWDYEHHECRHDCWKWDKEHSCYKE